jgi:hypothetical protein
MDIHLRRHNLLTAITSGHLTSQARRAWLADPASGQRLSRPVQTSRTALYPQQSHPPSPNRQIRNSTISTRNDTHGG